MKIVILDGYTVNPGDLSWEGVDKLGNLTVYDRTPRELTLERSKDADAVFTNKVIFDQEIIKQLPRLKYIGVLATGYNVVDIEAAAAAGIVVTNIPAYSTASVAQLVFAHILHHVHHIAYHAESVKRGNWTHAADFSYHLTPQIELEEKTLGIIGFGQIGQMVAKLGLAFGMRIIFNNRSKKNTDIEAWQTDLDTLYKESDFISINCPLTKDNAGFINHSAIEKMKPTAIIINTGRGPLIDEQALANALNSGRIAGAGIDVLSTEPPTADNPLLSAKNCYITPHIAWATIEARGRLIKTATNNLKAFIEGHPVHVIN